MTEARGDETGATPFDQWLAAARPPAKAWRVALGICIGVAVWWACYVAVPWIYLYGWVLLGDPSSEGFFEEMSGATNGSTYLGTLVLLLSSAGFWIGAYLVARFHGQPFWSLVSAQRRLNWNGFRTGVLLCVGLALAGMVWDTFDPLPGAPYANGSTLANWLWSAGPVIALVFIQAGGEELFFRGYVMQRLAARYRNPVIWAFLPSAAFGALHFFNGVSLEHSIYYVISTAIFGVTAAAIVWRTGDLSAAIGLHVATNVIAFLVSGTDDFFTATPLWLWPVETSIAAMPSTIVLELLLLGFVLWGPFPGQPRARRNVTRAAP